MARNTRRQIRGTILVVASDPQGKRAHDDLMPLLLVIDVGGGKTATIKFKVFDYNLGRRVVSDQMLSFWQFYAEEGMDLARVDLSALLAGKPIWLESTYVKGGFVYKILWCDPWKDLPPSIKPGALFMPLHDQGARQGENT